MAGCALSSAALLGPLGAGPAQATPQATSQATTLATVTKAAAVTTKGKVTHEAGIQRAEAAASRARARVDALVEEYQATSVRVDSAVRALSAAFAAGDAAEVDDEEQARQEDRLLAVQSAQVRAVYVAGGPAGLTGSVLDATSPDDALWRVSTAERVLGILFADTSDRVSTQVEQATVARRRATAAGAAVEAQATALNELQRQATDAAALLAQAQATLATLDTRAREAKAAQEAARQIAAAAAAARAANRAALGQVTALGIPAEYQIAYQAAALTCPGLSWTLLAAVGQVETGHGRNNRASSAGAIGPMQFMPRTFAAYGVDGDQDGVTDAWDPQDAIFSAAHYLCESGAKGGSAAGNQAALLAYNHAQWYVDLVLAAEQAIIERTATANRP